MNDTTRQIEKLRDYDKRLADYLARAKAAGETTMEEEYALFTEGFALLRSHTTDTQAYFDSIHDLAIFSPEVHDLMSAIVPKPTPPMPLLDDDDLFSELSREDKLKTLSSWVKAQIENIPPMSSAVDQYLETTSSLSPTTIRDAHVLSLAREYVKANYADVVEVLSKDKESHWYIPPEERKTGTAPSRSALWFFTFTSFHAWTETYGETVLDVSAVVPEDVYTIVERVVTDWAAFTGFSLEDRGPAIYPRQLSPYLSTSKAARRFHEMSSGYELELTGGRTKDLRGRNLFTAVTGTGPTEEPIELSQTHQLVSDAIASLYHSHREKTGDKHARFTLTQITQQVMGKTKVSEPQEREVKSSIEFLRRHMFHARGTLLNGERLNGFNRFLVEATYTSVTNRLGNTVEGYQITNYPAVFGLSWELKQARQVDALLRPRAGGWWPRGLVEMTVYHVVCRLLFSLKSERNKEGYSEVLDEELQRGLGGDWAPDVITDNRRRKLKTYRRNALDELQARGFILSWEEYKGARADLGAKVVVPDEFPRYDLSPEDKRRLER